MIWLDGPLSAEPLENLKRIAMSIGYRVIRLIAMVEARYGTGSGSDRAPLTRSLPLPVPERSFPYIQLKCADRNDDDTSGPGRPGALTKLSDLKPEVCL